MNTKELIDLSTFDLSKIPDLETFPKEYADVFTKDGKPDWRKCAPGRVSLGWPFDQLTVNEKGRYGAFDLYEREFRIAMKKIDDSVFSSVLTYLWLRNKFNYEKKFFTDANFKDDDVIRAYGEFMHRFVGTDQRLYFGPIIEVLGSYIKDLWGIRDFFQNSDPRKTPPVQPFRNLFLCHYVIVSDIDERMSLLKKADELKLSYFAFLDYVCNWVECFNAKYGRKYLVIAKRHEPVAASVVNFDGKKKRSKMWLNAGGKIVDKKGRPLTNEYGK